MENKIEIMQHVLKIQQISLLHKYIKLISSVFLLIYFQQDATLHSSWSSGQEFLAIDTEVSGSIPSATRFSE